MKLDFGCVPFSYRGSYLAFSYPQNGVEGYENDLTLRILYGMFRQQDNFPIYLLDDNEKRLKGMVQADECEIILSQGKRQLKICYQNQDTVIIKSNSKAVIIKSGLHSYDRVIGYNSRLWELTGTQKSLMMEIQKGTLKNQSVWKKEHIGCDKIQAVMLPDENGEFICQLTVSGLSYKKPEKCTYNQALKKSRNEYLKFGENFKTKQEKYTIPMKEAQYICWHSIVHEEGFVKYPVMLMTKNYMNQVWSWDYAINALALVDKDPELAYGQFLAMCAVQDRTGVYPDCFQAYTMIRNFVKPPIQGFILKKMFRITRPDRKTIKKLYYSVAKLTEWWFTYRCHEGDLPEYLHGNDSGWDNSTVFSSGIPVQSPDLCAWLIEQIEFLADTAGELGYEAEENMWRARGEQLFNRMVEYFVQNNYFVAYKMPEKEVVHCESLLLYIPLILGDRLPELIRKTMLDNLLENKKFLTKYGFASEPVDSPDFCEDGYWRGAIWPPTALIFTEILMRNHKKAEAHKNAESFCDLCAKEGFFENYSALDGHGLRDSGFTWTASTFLILLRDYLDKY